MALPSLENLRCFVEAARLSNFSKAARRVSLTPAAFGQRIKQLEERLGAALFMRTTRAVSLTEAGTALLPVAERCIEAAEDCERAVNGELGRPAIELVLGTRHELGMSWVLPQIDRLAELFPWLSLHLYFGSGPDLLLRTRTLEVDCAITSSRFTDPKLDSIRLHREDYVLCGAPRLLGRAPLTRAEQARGHTIFDVSAEMPLFRYWRDAPKGGDRMHFGQVLRLGSIDAIRARVLAGAGVAVLPVYQVRDDLKARRLRSVMPSVTPLHDYFRLVFRANDPRREVFESLAGALIEAPLK